MNTMHTATPTAFPSPACAATASLRESRLDVASAATRHRQPAGEPYLAEIGAGQIVRIVDLEGNQAVDALFYNRHKLAERLVADVVTRARDADHRPRHLRQARHARRRLRRREQHRPLRAAKEIHALLPRQLSAGH